MVVRSTVSKAIRSSVRATTGSGGGAGGGGGGSSYDTDAQTYFTAVEAADGESLESGVKDAINAFVVGCKTDSIWDAIKASCILAGAKTLDGALVPLVGSAPTSRNFVSGDYSRTTGLQGNGTTKDILTNRAGSADPQNNFHHAVYCTTLGTNCLMSNGTSTGGNDLFNISSILRTRNRSAFTGDSSATIAAGLNGSSRSSATQYSIRTNGTSVTRSVNSETPLAADHVVFSRTGGQYTNSTIAFYSIGEALDLAILDSRVSTLITAIGAALA